MEIYINVLGPNHIGIGTSYINSGLVHESMRELEQARVIIKEQWKFSVNLYLAWRIKIWMHRNRPRLRIVRNRQRKSVLKL